LRDPGGLEGEPGRSGELARGGGELGGVKVNAAAGGCGVEKDTGGGALVVGDAGTVVEGERSEGRSGVGRLVVFASEDDVEAARGEEGAQAEGEREGDVLLDDVVGDAGTVVSAAVRGVNDDSGGMEGQRRQGDEGVMKAPGGGFRDAGFGGGCCCRAGGGAGRVGVGDGKGVLVGRRRGLRLGLLLRLLVDAAEGQSGEREQQNCAEEGDVSCRSLLRRDQAVAFWRGERRTPGSIVPGEMRGERSAAR